MVVAMKNNGGCQQKQQGQQERKWNRIPLFHKKVAEYRGTQHR